MFRLLQLERYRLGTGGALRRLLLPLLGWSFFELQTLYMIKYRWFAKGGLSEWAWRWALEWQGSQMLALVFGLWIGYEAVYLHRHQLWGRYAVSGLTWAGRAWWQVLMVATRVLILLALHALGLPMLGWLFGIEPSTVLSHMEWVCLLPQAVNLLLVGLLSCAVVNAWRHLLAMPLLVLYLSLEPRLWQQLQQAFASLPASSWLPANIGQRLLIEYPTTELILAGVAYILMLIILNSWFLRRTPL